MTTQKPYLLKPLSPQEVALVKQQDHTWLEDVCIPWGWMCLTPMWVTGLDSIDYWVLRYRDARRHGLAHFLPRIELRGLDKGKSLLSLHAPFRPSLLRLLIVAPAKELGRRTKGVFVRRS